MMDAGKRKKGGVVVVKTSNGFANGGGSKNNASKFRRSSRGTGGSSSGGKKYYRCGTCSYVTHVKARFTKHVKYHSMPLIKCNFCDFKTPYKWNLDRHLKNHNDDGELKCPLCNFSTDIKQSLTVHVQNHHTSVPEHQRVALGLHAQLAPEDEVVEEYENEENEENVMSGGDEEHDDGDDAEVQEEDEGSAEQNLQRRMGNGEEAREEEDKDEEEEEEESRKSNEPEGVGEEDKLVDVKKEEKTEANSSNGTGKHGMLPGGKKVKDEDEEEVEEEDENFEKKTLFLQSLSLKPNVVYSVGNGNSAAQRAPLPSPPKVTTTKSSPHARRPSVTSELSGGNNKKSGPSSLLLPPLKKNKEKKLGLEELTQKLVAKSEENEGSGSQKNSLTITSNSTRCQFCRQRCKTSTDLALHLTVCSEAAQQQHTSSDMDDDNNSDDRGEDFNNLSEDGSRVCPPESKIFVWNNKPGSEEEEVLDYEFKGHFLDASGGSDDLVGFETAPGVGAVHVGQLEEAEYEGYKGGDEPYDEKGSVTTTRNVFRCPQPNCGFWATTASRFHVHIVGHYNLKPFECSQCSYKSNWRWDITKHIKLKELRDPSHAKAKVLLTHESGQRNYRKYDRYLVMMQLKHSADSKLPDCSTVASKRSDVALELSPSPGTRVVVPSPKVSPQQQQQQHQQAQQKQALNIAMPKLTRAPITSRASSPSESVKSEEGGHRPRPPPALVPISAAASSSGSIGSSSSSAASRTIVEKKMLSGGRILAGDTNGLLAAVSALPEISLEPCSSNGQGISPRKRPRASGTEAKRILWKCKKCPFKHSSKEIVVFHIRQFHKPKRGESVSILSQNHLMSIPDDGDDSQEASEPQPRKPKLAAAKETHQYRYVEEEGIFQCKFCPFTTAAIVAMEAHAENHFSKPNCNFSCNQCSFSVATKRELMEHVLLHGGDSLLIDGEEGSAITAEETPPRPRNSVGGGTNHKKYHCTECPYVTDSKGQFLYHKQFHRPRDCLFKCPQCSYNVSHKHLLHQHLRVHGLAPLSPSHGDAPSSFTDDEGDDEQPLDLHQGSERMQEDSAHPTVLVWRNGRPYRMYRCRFCPQVFGKVGDLTDHELSHNSLAQSPLQPQQNLIISPVINTGAAKGGNNSDGSQQNKMLYCCEACPARFFHEKELEIHTTFHQVKSAFQCELCSYSAKQQNPHLMSHMKVHGQEYQLKTQQLLQRYPKAPKKKKPPVVANKPMVVPLNIPKVIPGHFLSKGLASSSAPKNRQSNGSATISCPKCPAKFQSNQSYQQHSTFHGRQSIFRCRNCDYGVDTLKNLTLHELLHAGSEVSSEFETGQNGTILLNGKKSLKPETATSPPLKDGEALDDEAYVGNPEFTYPTYVKNGRVKSKRYKCSKCPSAFEKRDQYKVHMGLHGSDQRYKCTVCDYAVTYYANFIQHLKKHSSQPEVPPELLVAKPFSKMRADAVPTTKSTKSAPTTKLGCTMCSFKTTDEKALNEHMAEHDKAPSYHKCYFCAFVATSKADLKEHVRLHFQVPADSVQTEEDCLFSDEVDEKNNYSEKENYDDDTGTAKGSLLKSKLNGDVVKNGRNSTEEPDDDEGEDNEEETSDVDDDRGSHRATSPSPIDCSV